MTTIGSDIHRRLDALEADAAKGRLLTKYAEREPKEFIQYDAFQPEVNDDSLFSVHTVELMRGSPCRVLIDPATASADAVVMLRLIADWIERAGLPDPDNDDLLF